MQTILFLNFNHQNVVILHKYSDIWFFIRFLADLSNVSYQVLDACSVPSTMDGDFDLVMLYDLYHDVPYPHKLLDGVHQVLKKEGKFIMNEIPVNESLTVNKTKHG